MTNKTEVTQEQANAIDNLLKEVKGMKVVDLLDALRNGYEIVPSLEVGEWVARVNGAPFDNGSVLAKVRIVYTNSILLEDLDGYYTKVFVRPATPEEVKTEKERQKWADMGREVGEFRKGDIGWDGGHLWQNLGNLSREYARGNVKKLFPAESAISFEEDASDDEGR